MTDRWLQWTGAGGPLPRHLTRHLRRHPLQGARDRCRRWLDWRLHWQDWRGGGRVTVDCRDDRQQLGDFSTVCRLRLVAQRPRPGRAAFAWCGDNFEAELHPARPVLQGQEVHDARCRAEEQGHRPDGPPLPTDVLPRRARAAQGPAIAVVGL